MLATSDDSIIFSNLKCQFPSSHTTFCDFQKGRHVIPQRLAITTKPLYSIICSLIFRCILAAADEAKNYYKATLLSHSDVRLPPGAQRLPGMEGVAPGLGGPNRGFMPELEKKQRRFAMSHAVSGVNIP